MFTRVTTRIFQDGLIIWGDTDKILDVGGVAVLEKNLKNYRTYPHDGKPQETASYYVSYLKGKN